MNRRNEVLVGILLTAATVIAVVGTIWLARGGLNPGYPLYVRFAWGAGLKPGQPVLLAGAQVGYVGDVKFEPQGSLLIQLRIDKAYRVPAGSTAKMQAVGLFGDQAVALTPPLPPRPNGPFYAANDTVPNGPPSVTIDAVLARVDSVSSSVSDITKAVQVQLVQQGGLQDLRSTIGETNRLVAQLSGIAAEQSRQLSATMTQLRHTAAAVDSAQVDSTVRNLKLTTANAAALTDSLRVTTGKLNATIAQLQGGSGTAGKLLTDTLLYRDVRNLVGRLDSLSTDLQRNPKKYINLRIF